jgi:hypothetical protein
MFTLFRVSLNLRFYLILAAVGILSLLIIAPAAPSGIESPEAYPNPAADIPWNPGYSGVNDIKTAFNYGRTQENSQLSTSIPLINSMPSQSTWNGMSDNAKALWLIDSERQARGINRLHGYESNITQVAQDYADFLLANDAWGHNADGSPADRKRRNPVIRTCYDDLLLMENLYALGQTGGTISLPIERAIYRWMYHDATSWGHRYLLLYDGFLENGGPSDREGLMGIGRASGGDYTINSTVYPVSEIVVFNMFDPCSNWNYDAPPPTPGEYFLPLVCR